MNIIICGAGRVGYTIAKLLSEQGHSITVIEWPYSLNSLAIVNPTLPAPQIIIFILIKFFYPKTLQFSM